MATSWGARHEEASIVSGELVVSCGNAAEVFDLAKEALDQIAILVDRGMLIVVEK